MRIELYKLNKIPNATDSAARIQVVSEADLRARNRSSEFDLIRLETSEQKKGLWFCDFVRQTAFLWDPSNDWRVVQYNHHGVRPAAVAAYLGTFDVKSPVTIELLPKMDDQIHAKISPDRHEGRRLDHAMRSR